MTNDFFKIFQKIAAKKQISRELNSSHICAVANDVIKELNIIATAYKYKNNVLWLKTDSSIGAHQIHANKDACIAKITERLDLKKSIDIRSTIEQ